MSDEHAQEPEGVPRSIAPSINTEKPSTSTESSKWNSPLVLAIIAGAIALLGNALGLIGGALTTHWKAQDDYKTETLRQQGNLVLEAIKTGNLNSSQENLRLIAKAKLLGDETKEAAILDALDAGIKPVLPSSNVAQPTPTSPALFDTTQNLSSQTSCLQQAGVKYVARYYAQSAWKQLTKAEAVQLSHAGIHIIPVYEDNPTTSNYFNADRGTQDATRAVAYAETQIGQPTGTVIFYVVEYDPADADIVGPIASYFNAVKAVHSSKYKIGVFGSGTVIQYLKSKNLVDFGWLASVSNWRGYSEVRNANAWDISQLNSGIGPCGIPVDPDVINGSLKIDEISFLVSQK